MVFTVPHTGHMNPLWPIIKELITTGGFKVSVYLDEKNKSKVESVGAEFKHVNNDFESFHDLFKGDKSFRYDLFLRSFLDLTKDNLEYFASEIENEQPDLIIYDILFKPFKWIAEFYNHFYNLGKISTLQEASKLKFFPKKPLPKIVCLSTAFAQLKDDDLAELPSEILKLKKTLDSILDFEIDNSRLFDVPDFVKKIFVTVLPGMQPNVILFDHNIYRFVGSTINQNFSHPTAKEELFKTILEDDTCKLIYVALGTVFNNSVKIYKTIIDSFKNFDQKLDKPNEVSSMLQNFKCIIALGEYVYGEINEMIINKTYEIPNNIILVKFAPQIDILKKASLFVTHGGMNSTSESIHFGGSNNI